MKKRRAISKYCQFGILAVCLFSCLRGYPPAHAQDMIPVVTVKDAIQDEKLLTMQDRTNRIDEHLKADDQTIQKISEDLAGIRGESRTIGVLIGILQVIVMVLTGKRPKPLEG